MKRDLEADLEARIRRGASARDAIAAMLEEGLIASPKQAWRTLEKWCRQKRYEYGVCLDLGWMADSEPRQ